MWNCKWLATGKLPLPAFTIVVCTVAFFIWVDKFTPNQLFFYVEFFVKTDECISGDQRILGLLFFISLESTDCFAFPSSLFMCSPPIDVCTIREHNLNVPSFCLWADLTQLETNCRIPMHKRLYPVESTHGFCWLFQKPLFCGSTWLFAKCVLVEGGCRQITSAIESPPLLAVCVVAGITLSSAVGFPTVQVALLSLLCREDSGNSGMGQQGFTNPWCFPEATELKHPALSNHGRWWSFCPFIWFLCTPFHLVSRHCSELVPLSLEAQGAVCLFVVSSGSPIAVLWLSSILLPKGSVTLA